MVHRHPPPSAPLDASRPNAHTDKSALTSINIRVPYRLPPLTFRVATVLPLTTQLFMIFESAPRGAVISLPPFLSPRIQTARSTYRHTPTSDLPSLPARAPGSSYLISPHLASPFTSPHLQYVHVAHERETYFRQRVCTVCTGTNIYGLFYPPFRSSLSSGGPTASRGLRCFFCLPVVPVCVILVLYELGQPK